MDSGDQIKGELPRAVQLKEWPWPMAEAGRVRQELPEQVKGEMWCQRMRKVKIMHNLSSWLPVLKEQCLVPCPWIFRAWVWCSSWEKLALPWDCSASLQEWSSHGLPGWLQAEHCPWQSKRGGTANSLLLYLPVGSTTDPQHRSTGSAASSATGNFPERLQLPQNSSLQSDCSVMQQLCCSGVLVSTTCFYIPS